jgi:hypothetical protein
MLSMVHEGKRLRRQWTCNQSQSVLFSRLPPELRSKIFEYVLGGRFLQITVDREGNLQSLDCSLNRYQQDHCIAGSAGCIFHPFLWHKPWGCSIDEDIPGSFHRSPSESKHSMLALLQTCRRM